MLAHESDNTLGAASMVCCLGDQDALGGNARAVMLATLSPELDDFPETLNTLRYAARARAVRSHALPNRALAVPAHATQTELRALFGSEHPELLEFYLVTNPSPVARRAQPRPALLPITVCFTEKVTIPKS